MDMKTSAAGHSSVSIRCRNPSEYILVVKLQSDKLMILEIVKLRIPSVTHSASNSILDKKSDMQD